MYVYDEANNLAKAIQESREYLEFKKAKYLFNKEDIPVIKLAELGNDAGIIGASIDINKK